MSNHYNSSLEWNAEQTAALEGLTRDDDDEEDVPTIAVTSEPSDGYFGPFEPPSRHSTSSFFSEGQPSQPFGPRGLSQERRSSANERLFDDRAFSIRLGEPSDLEPRRLSSPLVPIPPARSAQRQAQSFHALEDLRMRPSSLNTPSSLNPLDLVLAEREKVWRRSLGDAETLRRKEEILRGPNPIGSIMIDKHSQGLVYNSSGTPSAGSASDRHSSHSSRRFTSSRGTSPAVARELDLQAAADTYLQALSLDPRDESPARASTPTRFSAPGADPTWHFPGEDPPSPRLPRTSRATLTSSPRLPPTPNLPLDVSRVPYDLARPVGMDSPLQSTSFSRGRLSGTGLGSSRNSPLTTPRTLAASAIARERESTGSFTRSPLTQKRTLATRAAWEDESSPSEGYGSQEPRYELPPRLMTPPRESLSEQLQVALQHHHHHYALTVITGNSLMTSHAHERQCFLDESCPICLRSEVQADELMVVLKCKLLACHHVTHANCFKEAYLSISQHPFTFFKVNPSCVPPDQTRFVRGPRSGCIISLGLFHILSEVQFGHFKVENLGSTYDPTAEQDCLNIAPLAETSTGTRPLFSLRRGRLMVECHSPSTAERWRFQANYDLTGANSCVDLVFVDSESKVSVQLSIIFNTGNTWAIERLTIELPPPPLTKRIASSPQMLQQQLQQRGGGYVAGSLSPLHQRIPSNPSTQTQQSQNVQSVKSASQRLLQVQDSAKQHMPKHFKFPSALQNSTATSTPETSAASTPSPPSSASSDASSVNSSIGSSANVAFEKKPKLWDLPPNFASFEDHIPSLATTQLGSRFLQRKVEEGNPEFLAMLFEQLLDFLPALIVDLFGNYLCQSMVCHATDEQRYRLLVKIKPHLVPVACARQGTRMVQKLVELSTQPRDRRLILEALTGAWPSSEDTGPPPSTLAPEPTPASDAGAALPHSASTNLCDVDPTPPTAQLTTTEPSVHSSAATPTTSTSTPTTSTPTTATTPSGTAPTTSPTAPVSISPSTSIPTSSPVSTTANTATASSTVTPSTAEDGELPNWQVTDRAALMTLMKGSSGAHVVHAILDHWPVKLCRPIILFAFEMASELGVHQHGLCVLKKCLTVCTPEDLGMFVNRIQPQIFTFINDPYGNYLIQHLLERCDAPDTDAEAARVCSAIHWDLHRSLQGHYPWLSRQKFSSNVVEKCLRTPDLKLRSAIIDELTKESTISQLLQCSFGNYVMQHVLEVATPAQAAQVITRIQPDLRLLRKNIRKKWERLLLRYDADALPINDKTSSPSSSESSLHVNTPSSTSPSGSAAAFSGSSTEFSSQLLAHNRSLASEFRAFQAMQDGAHGAGDFNDHKTGVSRAKPRKPAPTGRVSAKEFVPEASQPSANADQARFRQQQFQQFMPEPPYMGYTYPQPSYVPYSVPRTLPPSSYVQQSFHR